MGRILLIDDDDVTRLLMRHLLEDAGYEVQETNSGEVALSILQEQEPFDLVITDLLMPAKDGLQTILEIQRLPRKQKIIAISSGGPTRSSRLLSMAKSYGALQTLLKPLSAESLLTAVREVLE